MALASGLSPITATFVSLEPFPAGSATGGCARISLSAAHPKRQLLACMCTWNEELTSRSNTPSATTALGNNSYKALGERLAARMNEPCWARFLLLAAGCVRAVLDRPRRGPRESLDLLLHHGLMLQNLVQLLVQLRI